MPSIFVPEISVAEKVLRSAVIYSFLLQAFRFAGKRQVGQLTPFDLVVLLILAAVLEDNGGISVIPHAANVDSAPRDKEADTCELGAP